MMADEPQTRLPAITADRKSGAEAFHHAGEPLGFDLLGFWQWSTSDLLSNATRGILAEFLVAQALDDAAGVRAEWGAFDATTEAGVRVEVKSSAYVQSWYQDRPSRICFGTRPTRAWEAETNVLTDESRRQADVYVFCVLTHRDQETIDPLDVTQWAFYVISTERLNAALGDQKSIGLSGLLEIGATLTDFVGLAEVVARQEGSG